MDSRFEGKTIQELIDNILELENKIKELEDSLVVEPKKVGRKQLFSDKEIEKIIEYRKQGWTHKRIAEAFNCSRSLVQKITSIS